MKKQRLVYLLTCAVCLLGCLVSTVMAGRSAEERKAGMRDRRALLREALDHEAEGKIDSAIVVLREAVTSDPGNADAHYHLGRLWLAGGDSLRAVDAWREGIARSPLSRMLRLALARLLFHDGKVAEAAAITDEALAIRARDGEALYLRGVFHLAQGDTIAALDFLDRALVESMSGRSR